MIFAHFYDGELIFPARSFQHKDLEMYIHLESSIAKISSLESWDSTVGVRHSGISIEISS